MKPTKLSAIDRLRLEMWPVTRLIPSPRNARTHTLVMSRGDYHWQHEPCWYAVRKMGNWTGDRKQTTLWTIPSGGQDVETRHSTQKPVECMRRPILNNSNPGHAIYEPFLGSSPIEHHA